MAEPGSQGPVLKGGRQVWKGPGGGGCNRGLEGLTARVCAQACHLQPPLVPDDESHLGLSCLVMTVQDGKQNTSGAWHCQAGRGAWAAVQVASTQV